MKASEAVKKIEVDPDVVDVFQTPEEMKDFMVSRATAAVEQLIQSAVRASSIFEVPKAVATRELEPIEDMIHEGPEAWHVPAAERPIARSKKKKEEYAEVDLGDGKTAKLRM